MAIQFVLSHIETVNILIEFERLHPVIEGAQVKMILNGQEGTIVSSFS